MHPVGRKVDARLQGGAIQIIGIQIETGDSLSKATLNAPAPMTPSASPPCPRSGAVLAEFGRDGEWVERHGAAPNAKRALAELPEHARHPLLTTAVSDPNPPVRRVASWLIDAIYPTAMAEIGESARVRHFQNLAEIGRTGVRSRLFDALCVSPEHTITLEQLDQLMFLALPAVSGAFASLWCRRVGALLSQSGLTPKTLGSVLKLAARARPLEAFELTHHLLASADPEHRKVALEALPEFCLISESRPLAHTLARGLPLDEFFPLAEQLASRNVVEATLLVQSYGLPVLTADRRWRFLLRELLDAEGPSIAWIHHEISITTEAEHEWLRHIRYCDIEVCRPAFVALLADWKRARRKRGMSLFSMLKAPFASFRSPAADAVTRLLQEAGTLSAQWAKAKAHPAMTGRIAVLRDLLVVRGSLDVIPPWMGKAWVSGMHFKQIDAACRLESHGLHPVVTTTLVLRTFDSDADDVDYAVHSCLVRVLPRVGLPLALARSLNPDLYDGRRPLSLLFDCEPYAGAVEEMECLRLALGARRAHVLLQTDPEHWHRWECDNHLASEPSAAAHLEPGEVDALLSTGEIAATALYAPTLSERVTACRALHASHPLLAVGLAARIYSEPTVVMLTGDEANSFLKDRNIPPPPIPVPPATSLQVAGSPKFPVEAGSLLEAWAPEVKDWLDLDLPGSCFESESDPGIPRKLQELLASSAGLRRVYEALPE